MRLTAAFLKMIRLPNLIFMALTQVLFQFCIYQPLYKGNIPEGDLRSFILLLFASLFIAAAGYIINDYFDINIDEVNKPGKMVVDKVINRRWALAWHLMLSTTGLLLTFLALPFAEKWYLVLANIVCVWLLWFYSVSFKKNLLIGNIVIAALTSWTILIIFFSKVNLTDAFDAAHLRFFRLAVMYAGFAFVISLIREAIKDMEDIAGDVKYGCRTMPIVWGINATKVYVAVWLIVLIAALLVLQVYVLQFKWWLSVLYCLATIVAPLVLILVRLKKANTAGAFHHLSNLTKLVMLTGILSMLFFYFYL
ncbi:MAG TPA: geranylgeranylglycerol-phosphate geranylgeranyltransferase [Chitinophagaceae bacterium]|jgi:4-hydroxybenzoate polyprenyltransferase|nr:geranylgeranylglycerol-phosphate geranylgeranyltransferase [Chitinophagaceae bacterium]HMU57573.1 geranylgeranylglycerol-phosphate geranylgeranyltransferase [Chitinophagaceae bacterium]